MCCSNFCLLRPSLYKKIFNIETEELVEPETGDVLRTASPEETIVVDETPVYADGYSAEDFASMEPPEELPKLELLGGVWDILTTLKFNIEYDDEVGEAIFKPLFKKEHLALENTTIIVEGFIIPIENVESVMDVKGDIFMLSALPAASCFFCNAAGPDSNGSST